MSIRDYSFEEVAQEEFRKRKGYKNNAEFIKKVGVKEYKKLISEFYEVYRKEIKDVKVYKKESKISDQIKKNKIKDSKLRIEENRRKIIESMIERTMLIIEEVKQNRRSSITYLSSKYKIPNEIMSSLVKKKVFIKKNIGNIPGWHACEDEEYIRKCVEVSRDERVARQKKIYYSVKN